MFILKSCWIPRKNILNDLGKYIINSKKNKCTLRLNQYDIVLCTPYQYLCERAKLFYVAKFH